MSQARGPSHSQKERRVGVICQKGERRWFVLTRPRCDINQKRLERQTKEPAEPPSKRILRRVYAQRRPFQVNGLGCGLVPGLVRQVLHAPHPCLYNNRSPRRILYIYISTCACVCISYVACTSRTGVRVARIYIYI